METITQAAMMTQNLLGEEAKRLGRETGFIRRERKFNGASFAQGLVFGWLANPHSSVEELSQSVANGSRIAVSRQGVEQRFTARAAFFLERLVEAGFKQVIRGVPVEQKLLARFTGVYVIDSTVITLPEVLSSVWAGGEGSSLKIAVCWDLKRGGLEHVSLGAGREHDQHTAVQQVLLPPGALRLADLGFFDLNVLEHLSQTQGYWITRYKGGTQVSDLNGQGLDLVAHLAQHCSSVYSQTVRIGKTRPVLCRLVAQRVPPHVLRERHHRLREWETKHQCSASSERYALCAWTILLTNVPEDWLSNTQVRLVYALRWQIELLFKLWKSVGEIDTWSTANPWRILCEIYAKLLALMIQHACLVLGGGHALDKSLLQAARTIAKKAWHLARVLHDRFALLDALQDIIFCLRSGCRVSRSASSLPTFQSLEA